jgi:hypothetical protein
VLAIPVRNVGIIAVDAGKSVPPSPAKSTTGKFYAILYLFVISFLQWSCLQ